MERFTETGNLEELLTYRNGTLHGPAQAYYGRGMPVSDGTYYEGAEEGSWTFYLDDGTLQEISGLRTLERTENIRVNGPFTDWYGEDVQNPKSTHRNKKLDGPFREWHDQGRFCH